MLLRPFIVFLLFFCSFSASAQIKSKPSLSPDSKPNVSRLDHVDSVQALFKVLSQANRLLNYETLLTYEANGFITTYQLSHRVSDDQVDQTLTFIDGPKRQVTRKQNVSACDRGATRWGLWPMSLPSSALSAYELKPRYSERIANREAQVFDIIPEDDFRYGYQYSVDKLTGLLLRSSTYHKGAIIERMQAVSVELFDHTGVYATEEMPYIWRVPEVDPCYSKQFTPAWQVDWLPEGFEAVGNRVTAKGEQVLIFSDGLVSISVFIIQRGAHDLPKASARHGSTVAVVAPLNGSRHSVAVVGEVPVATARKIAVSVKSM